MKLVEMKCKNCGSKIKIKEDQKEAVCDFCRAEYKLDDEVQHIKYDDMEQVGYDLEMGKIKARKEATSKKATLSRDILDAKMYLEKMKDYDKAYKLFFKAKKHYPFEPEVYKGLIKSITHDFNYLNKSDYPYIVKYYDLYVKVANKNELEEYDGLIKQMNENIIKSKRIKKNIESVFCWIMLILFILLCLIPSIVMFFH